MSPSPRRRAACPRTESGRKIRFVKTVDAARPMSDAKSAVAIMRALDRSEARRA